MTRINELIESDNNKTVTRLNCASCQFVNNIAEPIIDGEINGHGGMCITDKHHLEAAKKVRLITLPSNVKVTEKRWCNNPKVDQWVTPHMWCTEWNAPDTLRSFKTDN